MFILIYVMIFSMSFATTSNAMGDQFTTKLKIINRTKTQLAYQVKSQGGFVYALSNLNAHDEVEIELLIGLDGLTIDDTFITVSATRCHLIQPNLINTAAKNNEFTKKVGIRKHSDPFTPLERSGKLYPFEGLIARFDDGKLVLVRLYRDNKD